LQLDQGFYRLCTSYDSFVLSEINGFKGIDKGEAETYAQYRKIGAQFLISDDKKFINALSYLDQSIKVFTTLHLLSWLEILNYLEEWEKTLKTLYTVSKFSSKDIRLAYTDVLQRFGINKPKKEVNLKSSLKKIIHS